MARWVITSRLLALAVIAGCTIACGARHAMEWAYVPALVGTVSLLLAFILKWTRWKTLAAVSATAALAAAVIGAALVVGRWQVPLRPGEVAALAAKDDPSLGPHPYCFSGDEQQGQFFGRVFACYPHHVTPGKITDAEANAAVGFWTDNKHIHFMSP